MNYDNSNRGIIGKNDRKSKDTDADLSGHINVDGVEYWLNGWKKTNSKDNSTFYSLSVKPKQPRQEQQPENRPRYSQNKENRQITSPPNFDGGADDDLPF